mmetsp:Transcript_83805/g.240959  ORF Transcript_83805/g.240959 Transcript_83805/m.240959 type:complete len:166 (-) Transcript_83805:42-539(-)|eukprot:CAMPEP_0177221794 /NCGR_PEP_ID=MMETSP0367-20130122/37606_1 /TAXON_ID=447022 ORGANISM="Scrippsiella hangoei-like, Strain SHHI-4" /NCGR_SAMPLE_ID=MMETSP0367 /ASSEMBLY_ACC=CAM_ASM_000362 /LENGTH=165 /DNA_ID=CAMNT_0018671651 /DNA_START=74 /DNA_END=571 /DNA_ORIENTATION=+
MRSLLLLVALLSAFLVISPLNGPCRGVVVAAAEESADEDAGGDEESIEEEEEPDAMEDQDETNTAGGGEDAESMVRNHPKGEECIKVAEELEREVGLFDNSGIGADGRKKIAEKMKEHADKVTGKDNHNEFQQAFHAHLEKLHSSSGTFGAIDACIFLLKHHDEL